MIRPGLRASRGGSDQRHLHAHPLAVLGAAGIVTAGALLASPELPGAGLAGVPAGASGVSTSSQEFPEVPYDGRYTFVRIAFDQGRNGMGSFGGFGGRGRGPVWAHDYPRAERNFLQIVSETTFVDAQTEGSNVLTLDDPD